jgi:hypothetical protein
MPLSLLAKCWHALQDRVLFSDDSTADGVFVGAEPNGSGGRVIVHVPDTSGSIRNWRDRYDFILGWIEADKGIGRRLATPLPLLNDCRVTLRVDEKSTIQENRTV